MIQSFPIPKIGILFLLGFCVGIFAQEQSDAFPVPLELKPNVEFWIRLFTQYSKDEVIIHDKDSPLRIYAVISCKDEKGRPLSEKARKEKISKARERIEKMLEKLCKEPSLNSDTLFSQLRGLFSDSVAPEEFCRAKERIRTQTGLRESFKEGLVRSGRYMPYIRERLSHYRFPEELAYLPHVESSFNIEAKSKAGAVGMWQFARSTGKLFLHITDEIDERKDPFLSTEAAIRLLKKNYEATGRWPLALTAYQHGLASVKKAMEKLGTSDLEKIIQYYDGENFGFASKNFYAEFVAAVHVAKHASVYFPDVKPDPPLVWDTLVLPISLSLEEIAHAFHVSQDSLLALNPSFLTPIRKNHRPLPRGFSIRIPKGTDEIRGYQNLVAKGLLPRGAYRAWCSHFPREVFYYIEYLAPPKYNVTLKKSNGYFR